MDVSSSNHSSSSSESDCSERVILKSKRHKVSIDLTHMYIIYIYAILCYTQVTQLSGKKYVQKYRKSWEKRPCFKGWLQSTKDKKAYCKVCHKEMQPKSSVLKTHGKTNIHIKKMKALKDPTVRTLEQTVTLTPTATRLIKKTKEAELKLVAFLAEHNLPFLVMDHLSDVIASACPDSQIAASIQCKRTKATSIVNNVFGTFFYDSLAETLKKTCFSVIIDETTDVAAVKEMCVMTRFYNEETNKVDSRFFGLIEVPRADSETLFQSLKQHFDNFNIPFSNIIGYGADGASTMMGSNNSVKTRMETANPSIFVMRCTCHSAHLAASNACATLPKETEEFVRDVYTYFSHSAKRISVFQQFQYFTETKPHKLLRPSQTRWLSLYQCVNRVLEQWEALSKFFANEVSGRHDADVSKAGKILGFLKNPHFKLFFEFLAYVLPKFQQFNLLFQSKSPNLHILHSRIQLLYRDFLSCYMKPSFIRTVPLEQIDPTNTSLMLPLNELYLGVNIASQLVQSTILTRKDLVHHFLRKCLDFFITSALEIRKRFPINDSVIYSFGVLDPDNFDNFSSLRPLACRFPNLVLFTGSSEQVLDDEWRQLRFHTLPFDHLDMPIDEFWGKVSCITDGSETPVFGNVSKFMKSLLALPHSSADAERLFSAVTLIKSKTRNRLNTRTVTALLLAKEGVQDCTKFNPPPELIQLMNSENLYT